MGQPNQVQYPRPRCPRCRAYRHALDPQLRRLGFELREVSRTPDAVLVRCQFCHYAWRSRNAAVLGGVLPKEG